MFPFAASGKGSAGLAEAESLAFLGRAPKIKDAAEKAVAVLVKNLQKMAGAPGAVEGHLKALASRDMREVAAAHGPSAAAGLVTCGSPACTMLATIDGLLLHALVDLFCGGSGREAPPVALRDATSIDQQFAHIAFKLFAAAIEAEWAQMGFASVSATRCDVVTADVLGLKVLEAGCVDISISVFGIAGLLRVVLPPVALACFAADERADDGASSATDGLWSSLLRKEIGQAAVRLDAYLDAKDIDLATLASLRTGQILTLVPEARTRASLVAQGHLLFRGEIGQADENYTLRIDDVLSDDWRSSLVSPAPRPLMPDLIKA